jgi:ubiquinone biosynthesis protein COQ4
VNYRVLATHDIHHLIRGFALNRGGETGVLSISVQQFAFPGFAYIDIASLLRTWLTAEKPYRDLQTDAERIESPRHKLECIVRGMAMGEEAQLLFPVDWHSLMAHDLEEVRRQLGIRPVREGVMSWASDPALAAVGI